MPDGMIRQFNRANLPTQEFASFEKVINIMRLFAETDQLFSFSFIYFQTRITNKNVEGCLD